MRTLLLIALSAGLLFTQTSMAAEMPAKANTCAGCHGKDGNSLSPIFPNLAGQHAQYLEVQLKNFRDGFRKNATMQPFAKGLTDQEIKELAAYFSAQAPK
ncbi:cytochrome C [Hydrogenovibrio sp. SC-1]|uniref:c-type cytochrome n=1 Tax=Hydrogenovibrio sp. SC-1 TaxID=2065820 RepID=UPI000C7E10EA|nr:cytochrome c [Hydrogenovibrio sp. SC-1]PLA75523.1 cytochrome C [Hydrogenovibrio sp. SC-1]